MRLNLALSGIEQTSNSIVLSGLVLTFRLFNANDIIVIDRKYWIIDQTLIRPVTTQPPSHTVGENTFEGILISYS